MRTRSWTSDDVIDSVLIGSPRGSV
jgi:hypothetical protein